MNDLRHFKFWCYKVLPLVYDDSLSYYEVLCKVVEYINHIIDDNKAQGEEIEGLREDLKTVQEWIDNFDTSYIQVIIDSYIAKMMYPEITDDGYFAINIPSDWDEITFNTTGYDIDTEYEKEYGHLVLSMYNDSVKGEKYV